MNGKSGAIRSLPIGAFVFHYSPLCMCVYVYSSSAASLFLGLWPEVHLHVANQQKMTDCEQEEPSTYTVCIVVAVLQFSQFRNISKLRVSWVVNSSIV